jgi:catechol 2,3-dioxygenase-like lactoylglutathione lyase family enzyme
MAERTLPTAAPAQALFSHVVMRTSSDKIDACVEFYEQLLGMVANFKGPHGGGALANDGEHHRIVVTPVPPAADVNAFGPGLEHMAFKMRSVADLLGNYKRCKGIGLEPFMTIHHGGTLSAYYVDPDGVQVETFIDLKIADLAIETMNSPAFMKNPIGVPVDFDELVARYEAGEAIASLIEQPEMRDGQMDELINKLIAVRTKS